MITIVGAGALGSHTVQFLRNVGRDIYVVDFDRIEAKNTMSQFHSVKSKGKPKVQALSQLMTFTFGADVTPVQAKLVDTNTQLLLAGAELVIDATDNVEARQLILDHATCPTLHGALAPGGDFGRVVWGGSFEPEAPSDGAVATCEDGEHLPFIAIVSGYLARAAQVFLATGKQIGFEISPTSVFST